MDERFMSANPSEVSSEAIISTLNENYTKTMDLLVIQHGYRCPLWEKLSKIIQYIHKGGRWDDFPNKEILISNNINENLSRKQTNKHKTDATSSISLPSYNSKTRNIKYAKQEKKKGNTETKVKMEPPFEAWKGDLLVLIRLFQVGLWRTVFVNYFQKQHRSSDPQVGEQTALTHAVFLIR